MSLVSPGEDLRPDPSPAGADPWVEASHVAALCAVDPQGLHGALVRAPAGPARDAWLGMLRQLMGPEIPWLRSPAQPTEDSLLGGLDLASTLASGRPCFAPGLLARADGGGLVLPMAERLSGAAAALLGQVLDTATLTLAREGVVANQPVGIFAIALDEGLEDEYPPPALREVLGLHLDLQGVRPPRGEHYSLSHEQILAARRSLPLVRDADDLLPTLANLAACLGVRSLRALLYAARVARASAALDGRTTTDTRDLGSAVRCVLAPRATQLPQLENAQASEPAPPPPPPPDVGDDSPAPADTDARLPDDVVLAAVASALGPEVLSSLAASLGRAARRGAGGRAGERMRSGTRGRPLPSRQSPPRRGERLDLVASLKAAAPWQTQRRQDAAIRGDIRPCQLRKDDLRTRRYRQQMRTTTLFVVDASGSAALHRLAEAKGAVELLLAECYVRRDEVALIAFRGKVSELLLPPTRSLVRARRCLAALPGGGGTPLAAAIESAGRLAMDIRRRGNTPLVVFFTDGRANIGLDGAQGREPGESDALKTARHFAALGARALLIDTSQRPSPRAADLATALAADYLPLPHADAGRLAASVARHTH